MVAVEENLSPRIRGGNGIAAGTVNYPGAAAHAGSGRSGFRGAEHLDFLGSTPIPLNIYYDANWQAIETRTNGTANSNVTSQMVWSAAYLNAAILQDTDSAGVIQPNSRLYFLQDANWDTTAVVGFNSTTGTWGVTQRYVYSPYGNITVLNADWSTPPAGTQPVVNNLYQGMTLDAVTGLYYERNRNYNPTLGIWISQDPLQYINGADTYQFLMSGPVRAADPSGLEDGFSGDEIEHFQNPVFGGYGGGAGYPSEGPLPDPILNPNEGQILSGAAQTSHGGGSWAQPWSNGPTGPMLNPKFGFPREPARPPHCKDAPPPPPPPGPPPAQFPYAFGPGSAGPGIMFGQPSY